ncbi:MAG: 2,3-bisphosphoglycerate-independent phosphoglycerate mutase [Dehalococcoidales bacterium]|nr:2,3-bisphosphoglycerate-independent phosphoglycerate mutase [Dehalococcoidales bacterium]
MFSQEQIRTLARQTPSKIVLLVLDGLGGLPRPETGKTELETARTPNFDKLASSGVCGLSDPVGPGITAGSAPGHTALFGYDPILVNIGRGVLEAVGIDFPIEPDDVLARGNFCTVDKNGIITDRRAGRIATELNASLCSLLKMRIDDIQVLTAPVKDHRFVIAFRGPGLRDNVSETDPQREGLPPLQVTALSAGSIKTANIANKFVEQVKKLLADKHPANMALLRGFSRKPELPSMESIYKLKPAAIASYPMYRGLARLVGMDILPTGGTFTDEIKTLKEHYNDYDFFFVHVKPLDAAGEDGDFDRKVKLLEELDKGLPELVSLKPDVIVVTGDHSTPAVLKGHSWHPVPTILYSQYCRTDKVTEFSESACLQGGLGIFPATQIMPLAMANALKLNKYGA